MGQVDSAADQVVDRIVDQLLLDPGQVGHEEDGLSPVLVPLLHPAPVFQQEEDARPGDGRLDGARISPSRAV